MTEPLFSFLVLTRNRPEYLRLLVDSINAQDQAVPHELVVVDNGSDVEAADSIAKVAASALCPTRLVRYERNFLSPLRWADGMELTRGKYVLLPGDDDVLTDKFLTTLNSMAKMSPEAVLLATGTRAIDPDGRSLRNEFSPVSTQDQAVVLATLFGQPAFSMVSTAIRRDVVNLRDCPYARTTIDWWIWFQALYCGEPASTSEPLVLYRRHPGQEARRYLESANRYEAARMLTREANSERFSNLVTCWTDDQLESFVSTVLESPGPFYGDRVFGPLIQMTIADVFARAGRSDLAMRLHAQAYAHAGLPASIAYLETLSGSELDQAIPISTWSRSNVFAEWSGSCQHLDSWRQFLGIPDGAQADAALLRFSCDCSHAASCRVTVQIRSASGSESATVRIAAVPDEISMIDLFRAMSTSLEQGSPDSLSRIETRGVSSFRRLRRSRFGQRLEVAYKKLMRTD